MPFNQAIHDREHDKFIERPTGETAVRTFIVNDSSEPIPVTGITSGGSSNATGPLKRTVATVTDTAANPIATALTNRVALRIRNKSTTDTVYLGSNATVTADDAATGGWEIDPGDEFGFDMGPANGFYLIAEAGKTPIVKIIELASSGSSGGVVTGTMIKESPVETVDGSNLVFNASQTPIGAAYFQVFVNGILQRETTHYTIVGAVVTFVTAPVVGQEIDFVYWY